MFATDFIFDSHRLSDFGCMICSFDGDSSPASGGEIEYNVVKAPNKDRFSFYGSQFNSVITWNFSFCKIPCRNDNMYFDQYEEGMLAKWLIRTDGYKPFQFDQEGFENVVYNVVINMHPRQIGGQTVVYDLSVVSDCGYGFSQLITKKGKINATTPLKFNVNNDLNTVSYPQISFNSKFKQKGNIFNYDWLRGNYESSNLRIVNNLDNSYIVSGEGTCPLGFYFHELSEDETTRLLQAGNITFKCEKTFPEMYVSLYNSIDGEVFKLTPDNPTATITQDILMRDNKLKIGFDFGNGTKEIVEGIIKPTLHQTNDFYIQNDRDLSSQNSEFKNVDSSISIELDSENDIITGLNSPNDFNWNFMRLVDGLNTITTNSQTEIDIEIQYREVRRVII